MQLKPVMDDVTDDTPHWDGMIHYACYQCGKIAQISIKKIRELVKDKGRIHCPLCGSSRHMRIASYKDAREGATVRKVFVDDDIKNVRM